MRYGWNATSYQILNPGFDYWFAADGASVVGYTRRYRVLLVAGAPVCAEAALTAVCAGFEAFAREQGCRVCYVCAEERLQRRLDGSTSHATVALGAQPAWDPHHWTQLLKEVPSLRAQLNRSRNKGVAVEPMAPETAAADPEIRCVLREWVHGRRLPPLHFLVEPDVFDGVVADRLVLVARREGKMTAFLVASPVPARNGYLVELLARSAAAPNGTSELLIDEVMRRAAGRDCTYMTLGLVALAHAADPEIASNPFWLRPLMRFARVHANRFYSFRGLEQFRLKMHPHRWEPVYAVSNEQRFSISTLYAMGAAFSGIPPWKAVAIGVAKAVREELTGR